MALDIGEDFLEQLKQQEQNINFNISELDEVMYQLNDLHLVIKNIVRKTNTKKVLEQQKVDNTCKNIIELRMNIDEDRLVRAEENIAEIFKQPTDK